MQVSEALADLYFRALHSRFTCICILFTSSCFSVEKLPEDASLAKRRNKYKSTIIFITNCLDNAEYTFLSLLYRKYEKYLESKQPTKKVITVDLSDGIRLAEMKGYFVV